jgi:hypothetical protein
MFLWFKAAIVYFILKTYALPTTVAMNVIGRVITNENAAFGLVPFVGSRRGIGRRDIVVIGLKRTFR